MDPGRECESTKESQTTSHIPHTNSTFAPDHSVFDTRVNAQGQLEFTVENYSSVAYKPTLMKVITVLEKLNLCLKIMFYFKGSTSSFPN